MCVRAVVVVAATSVVRDRCVYVCMFVRVRARLSCGDTGGDSEATQMLIRKVTPMAIRMAGRTATWRLGWRLG